MKQDLDKRYEIIEGRIALIEGMIKSWQEKLKSAKQDMEMCRADMMVYMQENGITTDAEGRYTYSIKRVPPSPIIIDESKVPDDYWMVLRSLDKAKINTAFKNGETVEGCQLSNGGETIQIRKKGT